MISDFTVQINPKETLPDLGLLEQDLSLLSLLWPLSSFRISAENACLMKSQFGILYNDASPHKIDAMHWQLYNDARADIAHCPISLLKKAIMNACSACKF